MTLEEFSRRGGLARAKKFTKHERKESARVAALARWSKKAKKKKATPRKPATAAAPALLAEDWSA